jgi:hypothetical protein
VKTLLSLLAVGLLMGTFLYPLFFLGVGKGVSWWLVAAMAVGGNVCMYLLVRFRKEL